MGMLIMKNISEMRMCLTASSGDHVRQNNCPQHSAHSPGKGGPWKQEQSDLSSCQMSSPCGTGLLKGDESETGGASEVIMMGNCFQKHTPIQGGQATTAG